MQHRRILFRMQQTVQMMGIGIGNRSSGRVRPDHGMIQFVKCHVCSLF